MKKVCVVGHFGNGETLLNGQTIKTKILTEELIQKYGKENVLTLDTHGGIKAIFRMVFGIERALRKCNNIVILPARNGVKIIPRIISFWNTIYKRKIHYDVIGGWLPDILEKSNGLLRILIRFTGIYVETESMKYMLNKLGMTNVCVVPNCKNLDIISLDELVVSQTNCFKLCTFSRVMREKGIEEAVQVVERLNSEECEMKYILDIYGQIDENQKEWFDELTQKFSSQVRYCGLVDYDKSTYVLKNYQALLFPTFYSGEGFAGTIIDALAAGVPVIASDWKYNREVITEGYNGMLFETHNQEAMEGILKELSSDFVMLNQMKKNCVKSAEKYLPSVALQPLFERM